MDRHDRQLTAETVVRDRQQSATPSYKTVNAQAPDLDETVRRLALAMVAADATSGCPEASRLWMHARVQHQSPLTRRACAPVRALVLAWFLRRYPRSVRVVKEVLEEHHDGREAVGGGRWAVGERTADEVPHDWPLLQDQPCGSPASPLLPRGVYHTHDDAKPQECPYGCVDR